MKRIDFKTLVQIILFFLFAASLLTPVHASAQEFEVTLPENRPGFCGFGPVRYPCPFEGASGPAGETTAGDLVLNIINLLLLIVGALSVLFLILGGYRYVTSEGVEERTESAKKTMTNAIIGLFIVILSFAIVAIITNFLIGGRV